MNTETYEGRIYSKKLIADFYVSQLNKFDKLGMGKYTENNVIVTRELVKITQERLYQLRPVLKIIKEKK